MRTIVKFNGTIPFRVKGQQALPVWQQRALQKAIKNGEGADGSLRFVCRIAADANEAFERIETTAGVFFLNPKAKAQFGRNSAGKAYLTVGVVHESTGDRYRLHWEGDAVPHRMKEVAVAHDEGKKVRAVTIKLNLADAKVWKLGEKTRRNTDRRSNHDTDKYGIRYPRPRRRSHNRLCASDLTPTDRLALAAT